MLRKPFAIVVALLLVLFAGTTHAQPLAPPAEPDTRDAERGEPSNEPETPLDVAAWSTDASEVTLPAPPDDYRTVQRNNVEWSYPIAATDDAEDLMDELDDVIAELAADLGTSSSASLGPDARLVIRIGRNPTEMHALAPVGFPAPQYASGVAYPRFGVILLTLTAPESWKRPNVGTVLKHELSHALLHRAVGGAPLPRWFLEGVAIYQAGEQTIDRMRTLWDASLQDRLIRLSRLDRRFPSKPHEVNIAYAQSADLVRFLRQRPRGERKFRDLLRHVREGDTFDDALLDTYFLTPGQLEREWREEAEGRHQAAPLLIGGGTVWVLAALLLFIGWLRKKRDAKKKLRRWAIEEAEELAAFNRMDENLTQRLTPPGELSGDERYIMVMSDAPPQGREPGIPTVEYEGRNHTLH